MPGGADEADLLHMTSQSCGMQQGIYKFRYVFRRLQSVEQPIRNIIIPVYRNTDKGRVYVLPTFDRQQDVSRLCTAVKDRNIIKLRRIFNLNLRVVLLKVILVI